ncbi:MAG: tail fiber domain-containing protein, partial [Opitutales bacterium]
VAEDATFSKNVTVNGNLTVLGTQTLVHTDAVSIRDAAIVLADNNNDDVIQSGIQIQYKPSPESAIMYAGLKRLPGTGEFVFFKDSAVEMESAVAGTEVYAPVLADSFNSASDERLKNKIVNLDGALDNIDHIRGVYHHWIDESQPQVRQIGVIAQEVQAIYPELVNEGGNGFLSVNYPKLTAVLLQSIKELKAMVLAQQEILSELVKKQ